MRNLLLVALLLISGIAYAQMQDTTTLVGKYSGAQSGGGSGYWQVSGTFTDESGLYDSGSIAVGDYLFFVDSGYGYHLPITEIVSAFPPSFVVKVSNVGITGVGAVPTGTGAIYRLGANGYSQYIAGLVQADQQVYNYRLTSMLGSAEVSKKDTTVKATGGTYIVDAAIVNPAAKFNNIDIAAISRSALANVAFLSIPFPVEEYEGVTYNVKADSNAVQLSMLSNGTYSNIASTYTLTKGQKAIIKAVYDNVYDQHRWKVDIVSDIPDGIKSTGDVVSALGAAMQAGQLNYDANNEGLTFTNTRGIDLHNDGGFAPSIGMFNTTKGAKVWWEYDFRNLWGSYTNSNGFAFAHGVYTPRIGYIWPQVLRYDSVPTFGWIEDLVHGSSDIGVSHEFRGGHNYTRGGEFVFFSRMGVSATQPSFTHRRNGGAANNLTIFTDGKFQMQKPENPNGGRISFVHHAQGDSSYFRGSFRIQNGSGNVFRITNDSAYLNKTIFKSSNTSLLMYNPGNGASGITAPSFDNYHTILNGTLNGTNGGTGNIAIGGIATANSSGTNFMMALGYSSNTSGQYAIGLGHNADATTDHTIAIGRNSLADEIGEISIGSSNYSKINLRSTGSVIINDGYPLPATNPSYTTGVKSIPVWTGTGSAATSAFETVRVEESREVGVSVDGGGNATVTFATTMPDVSYTFQPISRSSLYVVVAVTSKSTTSATIQVLSLACNCLTSASITVDYFLKDN